MGTIIEELEPKEPPRKYIILWDDSDGGEEEIMERWEFIVPRKKENGILQRL